MSSLWQLELPSMLKAPGEMAILSWRVSISPTILEEVAGDSKGIEPALDVPDMDTPGDLDIDVSGDNELGKDIGTPNPALSGGMDNIRGLVGWGHINFG
jgi:hypothetical protein